MDWQTPQALYLLWIVPVWIGLLWFARLRRARAARAFVSESMQARILPPDRSGRFWVRTALSAAAIALALVALARPRFGVYFEKIRKRGSDLYVLLDVSNSMLAQDVAPSRLERAKSDILGLLEHLQGERIGLIAFAGKPSLKCPLTTDLGFFRLALADAKPGCAPRGGTAIGDAIRKAIEVLPKEAGRDQALLVITDGEDHESYPLEAAKAAAKEHLLIFAVGLGDSTQGARIPGKTAGTYLRHEGNQVWSKLDESVLREIALLTNGAYIPAGTKSYDLGRLYQDRISKLRGEESSEEKRKRFKERYQLFLCGSLACFLLHLLIRPYPAQARTVRARAERPRQAHAAPAVPPPTPQSAAKVVRS